METNNSNPVDVKGIQIIEGAKVYRASQDDYKRNGHFIVAKVKGDLIELENMDGSKVNYNLATPEELMRVIR
jgi:hypothetical protein